jgi:hypothetical protein
MTSSFNILEICRMLNSDNTDDFYLALNLLYNEGHSKQDVAEFVKYLIASNYNRYMSVDKDYNITIEQRIYSSSGTSGSIGTSGTVGTSGYYGAYNSTNTTTNITISDPTKTVLITSPGSTATTTGRFGVFPNNAVPAKELEPPEINSKKKSNNLWQSIKKVVSL